MAETDSVKPGDTSGASAHAEPAHPDTPFDLMTFVPFLLNEAAETVARRFSRHYSERYDMTRSQWRIMANLGRNGKLTATELCHLSHLEKSVVSRAVHSMEDRGWILRQTKSDDRRVEHLMLTAGGLAVLDALSQEALRFDAELRQIIAREEGNGFIAVLRHLGVDAPAYQQEKSDAQ